MHHGMARVGVDVGGTFTDAIMVDDDGSVRAVKVLTRVAKPWISVTEAIERLGGVSKTEFLVHATTLGTNMLLGQMGLEKPEVVLLASRGFRDILEIGRQARPEPYNAFFSKPRPLVPRHKRIEISARVYPGGESVEPSVEEIRSIVLQHCKSNTVFVIHVLHCYKRPGVEKRVAEIVRRACPEALDVISSCDVDPLPGEYERVSTAVVNAILRPMFRRYLEALEKSLRARDFRGRILVMQSNGGLAPLEYAIEKPVYFIESGPAAGAVAAAALARVRGDNLVLSFDMGGTTAKASLITGYEPMLTDYFEVGGRYHAGRLVRGSGYPVRVPHIDLVEVSAGGGTIIWVDKGGALRAGPLSAGANPGPACYARGGDKPTITDAHLLLGRLPAVIADGLLELDSTLALSIYESLARVLGLDAYTVAAEALRLVNMEMARALRLVSIERGVEPSTATLYAFGGAGPLHAAELAEDVGIERVVVPPYAGTFSALGLVAASYRLSERIFVGRELEDVDTGLLEARISETVKILEDLVDCAPVVTVKAALRFRGQGGSLLVNYTRDIDGLHYGFVEKYRETYGMLPPEPRPPVVLDYVLVEVACPASMPRVRGYPVPSREHRRRAYFLQHGWEEATVYNGVPWEARGPAILELPDTTVVVPPGWKLERGELGEVILEKL